MKRNIVTIEMLNDLMPADKVAGYRADTSRTHIYLTNKRLKEHGVAISNVFGVGYRISDEDKTKINEKLSGAV